MRFAFLARLLGKAAPEPPRELEPPESVAAHGLAIARPSVDGLAALGLDDAETAAVGETVRATRALLVANLLRLRALSDPSAAPALRSFLRAAFEAAEEDPQSVVSGIEAQLRTQTHALLSRRESAFLQKLDGLIDAAGLFASLDDYLDRAFGVLEAARAEAFDEVAYLAANPDVAAAKARGEIASGRAHFLAHGAAEGRAQRLTRRRCDDARELIYPLRFCRDAASNASVGNPVAGAHVDREALLTQRVPAPYAIAVLSEGEDHDAAPSLASETSLGVDLPQFRALQEQQAWRAPPYYLAAFPDACVDLANGLVAFDRDKMWGDSAFATILSPGGERRAPEIFPLAGRFARLAADEKTLESETPLMLGTTWASRVNYGHWLMNSLSSAWLALDDLQAGRLRLLCPPLTARQRGEFVALGVPLHAIVETGARQVRVSGLIYPSPLATFANMRPGSRARDFLDFVKMRFRPAEGGAAPDYVFLSREGFPSARRMANEAALADALEKIGFHVARTHEMTLGEQIQLMSRAKLAVGQFGAALWNTPFMPQGARIVEIVTSNYGSNEYLYISHLSGHALHRVMIEASTPAGRASDGAPFDFEAPVAKIVALAQSLM